MMIEDLETDVMYIKQRLQKLEEMQRSMINMPNIIWAKYNKTPHKCPVCDGIGEKYMSEPIRTGEGDIGFYGKSAPCNPCEGKGVLWG